MVLNTNFDLNTVMDIDIDFSNFEKNNDACTGHVKSNTNDCGSLLCKSCLSHVTLYQIDFNEAFKICTNVQCEQSLTVDLTSCLIKRDFNRNRQCAQPTQDESANLGVIISNIIESKLHKIDSLLETTSITSEAESVINAEIQQPSNTQLDTNGNNNDFLSDLFDFVQSSDDVASTDNHQDHTNISLPSSPSNDEPLLTTTQLLNNELTNFTSATNDVQIDNNIVFDDNFISSLDDLLTDCEPTFGADFLLANSQSNAENTPGFKSQLLNVSSDTSQSLSLTELKPISQTDFYARMASDVYSNDFLNTNTYETFNQETNPIDANIQPIEDSSQEVNTTLISHSNRNNSSITISKVVTKTERTAKNKVQKESDLFMKIENDPPIEISIDQSKLKITDNMKEVIDLLATQSTPKQVSLKSKITNSQWTPKTADNDTISLLEWEKSAKNSRKKIRLDSPVLSGKVADQLSTSLKSSVDSKSRSILPVSKSNLSISKSNLINNKSLTPNQTTSRQSLLVNKSLFDTIKIENLTSDVKDNGKGYKDLVLSVLKKKTADV